MDRTVGACLCAGFLAIALGASNTARAAGTPVLTNAYLFSDWSSPTSEVSLHVPGGPASRPVGAPPAVSSFGFYGTTGVELLLSGSTVTGIGNTGPVILEIDRALTYDSHIGSIDGGNVEPPAAHTVNSEVGTWDDAGLVAENAGSGDGPRNLDYDRPTWRRGTASVRFNPVSGAGTDGYTALIIAEDAAFDPLGLSICSGASPHACQSIVSGFAPETIDSILARPDFVARDSSDAEEMDQAYVFLFSGPVSGFTWVSDIGNLGGERLEVDFIGATSTVPIPGAMWLLGTAVAGLAMFRRRQPLSASG